LLSRVPREQGEEHRDHGHEQATGPPARGAGGVVREARHTENLATTTATVGPSVGRVETRGTKATTSAVVVASVRPGPQGAGSRARRSPDDTGLEGRGCAARSDSSVGTSTVTARSSPRGRSSSPVSV